MWEDICDSSAETKPSVWPARRRAARKARMLLSDRHARARVCARSQKQNKNHFFRIKNNPQPSEGKELRRDSRRPRSISHSPLDAIIIIRKTINFKNNNEKKSNQKILSWKPCPSRICVCCWTKWRIKCHAKKAKNAIFIRIWRGNNRSNVVVWNSPQPTNHTIIIRRRLSPPEKNKALLKKMAPTWILVCQIFIFSSNCTCTFSFFVSFTYMFFFIFSSPSFVIVYKNPLKYFFFLFFLFQKEENWKRQSRKSKPKNVQNTYEMRQ